MGQRVGSVVAGTNMSYEQKTKAVDQMQRQITHDKMIILKDRGL